MQSSSLTQKSFNDRIITSQTIHVKNQYSNKRLPLPKQIQQAMINYCETLKSINLSGNNFHLPKNVINLAYPQLIELNLSGNNIGEHPQLNVPKIRNLNLSQTRLQSLSIYQQLPCLQILDLSSNYIKQFPCLNAPNLLKLYLNHNQIRNVDKLSSPEHGYLSLQVLKLNHNCLGREFPAIYCQKLQYLDLSEHKVYDIVKFCKKQYPNLKTFIIQSMREDQFEHLPRMFMPKLQTLILSYLNLKDIQDFSKGIYPQLENLEITYNYTNLNLFQLNAPKLKNINFRQSKVSNISQFLMGDYKYLENICLKDDNYCFYKQLPKLKNNIVLDKYFISEIIPQNQSLHQIEFYHMENSGKHEYQFIKLTKLYYPFYKDLLRPFIFNIKVLKLNLRVINSIQILFHLDIRNIRQIKIMNNHYLTSTYKNLTKINLCDQYLNNLQIFQFNQFQKPNIITFIKQQASYQTQISINIEMNEYWRRMYSNKNRIKWKTVFSQKNERCVIKLQNYASFETRLLSFKLKKVRNYCGNK